MRAVRAEEPTGAIGMRYIRPAIRCDIREQYSFCSSRPNISHKVWRSPKLGFGNLCSW